MEREHMENHNVRAVPNHIVAVWINPDGGDENFTCGCTATPHPRFPKNPCYEFRFCKLHRQAKALLEALKPFAELAESYATPGGVLEKALQAYKEATS